MGGQRALGDYTFLCHALRWLSVNLLGRKPGNGYALVVINYPLHGAWSGA